ncbi:MAG: regulatory iron-sulfur-containing complex subunit RicT [Planctomycetota bacterium]
MSIVPLPVFEADADPHHRSELTEAEQYAKLKAPTSMVVRFGRMKLVGEFPYSGDAKPGCGSKLVVRTHRGTEIGEMLTTTCENAGCAKSVTRKEMLEYIENSGGRDYPFYTKGRILRVATIEDLNRNTEQQTNTADIVRAAKRRIEELGLDMKLVDVEPIFGGEVLTIYYMSEDRVDFRELVMDLSRELSMRIDMRQVGARDEARLVADYERCGQHCCCQNFLKVLKPVSMRAAKMQKATLDPLKISGRCGRLMCCLRYEDQSYRELKANLPHRKTRVGTSEGPGIVLDSKILTQLVLVKLEHDNSEIAVPVEELMDPDNCPKPGEKKKEPIDDPLRGLPEADVKERTDDRKRRKRGGKRRRSKGAQQDAYRDAAQKEGASTEGRTKDPNAKPREGGGGKKRRRRRGKKKTGSGGHAPTTGDRGTGGSDGGTPQTPRADGAGGDGGPAKKKRRRRRGGRGRGRGGQGGGGPKGDSGPKGDGGGGGGGGGTPSGD